jgi:hypothetical protein
VGGVPDDESDEQWSGEANDPEDPAVAHDDIMKRLLDYQRSLRGDEEPEELAEAVATAEVEPEPDATFEAEDEPASGVVDLSTTGQGTPAPAETEPAMEPVAETGPSDDLRPIAEPMVAAEPAPPVTDPLAESRADLEEHVRRLEERLERLGGKVVALRQSFQEMAIAADERLAAMKDEIDEARPDPEEG